MSTHALITAALFGNSRHSSLATLQPVPIHTMRISSPIFDGFGHNYHATATRYHGSKPTKMIKPLSTYWTSLHNSISAQMLWQRNTTTMRPYPVRSPHPNPHSSQQQRYASSSTHNELLPSTRHRLDFISTVQSTVPIYNEPVQLGSPTGSGTT